MTTLDDLRKAPRGFGPNLGMALLPTLNARLSNDGERLETWEDRRARHAARGINGNGMGESLSIAAQRTDFDRRQPAIDRWEHVLGRPAPPPLSWAKGRPRLSARFAEWFMGLPDGWVTDVPGLNRAQQFMALGNGVVPQQAVYAIRGALHRFQERAA